MLISSDALHNIKLGKGEEGRERERGGREGGRKPFPSLCQCLGVVTIGDITAHTNTQSKI